jgi:putative inorganic carbon (hco3(-)) transporter
VRDYLLIAFILASLPIGLIQPYYGLLVYAWISYMYPHLLTWGFAQTFPVAKLSAISAIVGTTIRQAGDTAPLRQRESLLMLLFFLSFTLSSFFAFYPDAAWAKWQDVTKIVAMAFLASTLLTDEKRLKYFLLVIALSLGFYGLKGGIFSFRTGGEDMVWGPGSSVIGANNSIGLALNMCLPVFWYLAKQERGMLKRILQAIFFLSMPAIMFTYSRASALTLPIVLLAILMKGRHRLLGAALVLIAVVLAIPRIPDRWWNRQQTTLDYESDTSAMSRIDNWKFCWRLALDRPLTGGGFEFSGRETFFKYAPEFLVTYGKEFNSHNVFFSVLAAHGFPGFIFFSSMIVFTFSSCWQMKRAVRDRPDLHWIAVYADMVQVSYVGFIVNGIFVNMEYYDLVYHWVAVVCSLKVICNRALKPVEADTAEPQNGGDLIQVHEPVAVL